MLRWGEVDQGVDKSTLNTIALKVLLAVSNATSTTIWSMAVNGGGSLCFKFNTPYF